MTTALLTGILLIINFALVFHLHSLYKDKHKTLYSMFEKLDRDLFVLEQNVIKHLEEGNKTTLNLNKKETEK